MPLLWFHLLFVVCRNGLLGFPTSARRKVSISTSWWPVLYLVKILLFAWFPRKIVCESCCFLSICLTRLDFLAIYIYIFPDYLLIWQGDRKPKMRESSLKFDYKKFMKMNGQLGNYSCVWGWVGSFCLCLGVSSCLYVEPTIIRKLV